MICFFLSDNRIAYAAMCGPAGTDVYGVVAVNNEGKRRVIRSIKYCGNICDAQEALNEAVAENRGIFKDAVPCAKLDDIILIDQIQSRVKIDDRIVDDYYNILSSSVGDDWPFPPLNVVIDGGNVVLINGWHLYKAAKKYYTLGAFYVPVHVIDKNSPYTD